MIDVGSERINPYDGDKRQKGDQVRDMFDNIAPAYDFMNRAMTMGVDKLWRRRAVKLIKQGLSSSKNPKLLDVATGTGDLAMQLARDLPSSEITGIDLSAGMVAIGNEKAAKEGLSDRIRLEVGDCLSLPYKDGTFDCVTVAFGVRNFQDLRKGYAEMLRVLKPGGMLCVIELSTPTSLIAKPFYRFYTRKIIPLAGRMVSKDVRAYAYLPESIEAVPQRGDMCALIEEAGFADARHECHTFGVCTIYTANKRIRIIT